MEEENETIYDADYWANFAELQAEMDEAILWDV